MNQIELLVRWLRAIWSWLAQGKVAAMCLLVVIATLMLGMGVWRSEASIRISGFFLQLIGMIFAVRGLLAIRAHFGQPALHQLFVDWLNRFPRWKRQAIVGVGAASSFAAAMSVRAEVWAPDDPKQNIDIRLGAIIKNLERMREEQSRQYQVVEKLKHSHEQHTRLFSKKAEALEIDLRSDLESLHTGDILVSLVGLLWLTVGISLSTLAPEIVNWL